MQFTSMHIHIWAGAFCMLYNWVSVKKQSWIMYKTALTYGAGSNLMTIISTLTLSQQVKRQYVHFIFHANYFYLERFLKKLPVHYVLYWQILWFYSVRQYYAYAKDVRRIILCTSILDTLYTSTYYAAALVVNPTGTEHFYPLSMLSQSCQLKALQEGVYDVDLWFW